MCNTGGGAGRSSQVEPACARGMDDAQRAATKDATERAAESAADAYSAAAAMRTIAALRALGRGEAADAGIERAEKATADLARRNSMCTAAKAEQAAAKAEQAALCASAPSRGAPPAADAGIVARARAAARVARAAADEARTATWACGAPVRAAQ